LPARAAERAPLSQDEETRSGLQTAKRKAGDFEIALLVSTERSKSVESVPTGGQRRRENEPGLALCGRFFPMCH